MGTNSEALQLIADEFVRTLPDRMQDIHDAHEQLKQSPGVREFLDDFYHKVHNLSGSSGTFGFTLFSQISRDILNILEPAIKGETELNAEMLVAIDPALSDLDVEARAPVQTEGWL